MVRNIGTAVVFLCYVQFFSGQDIVITFYRGSTTLFCSNQSGFDSILWQGPPNSTTYYVYPGGFVLPVANKTNRLNITTDHDLVITDIQLDDQGNYSCTKGVNSTTYQTYNRKTTLVVRKNATRPTISSSAPVNGSIVFATEGQSVNIYCTSTGGFPALTVVLYNNSVDGEELVRTNTTGVWGNGIVNLTYKFTPKRQDDRQHLVCRSYWPEPLDAQDSQLTNVTVYLYLRPSQPTVTNLVPVVTGSTIKVECRTDGSRPAANISWTSRSGTLSGVTTVTEDNLTQTFVTVSELQKRVTEEDNGNNLTCKVSHLTGEWKAVKTLDVQFRPLDISIEKQGFVVANGTNTMSISCVTGSSNPAALVDWSTESIKTLTLVNSSTTGKFGGTVVNSTITFTPKREHDGLTVSCMARNNQFVNQPVSNSTMIDNLRYSPIINTLKNLTVIERDNVVLKCNANSKPVASFEWLNSSDTVAQGIGSTSYNGLNHTITAVSRNQAGTYTCAADNNIPPKDFRAIRLVVQYPPDVFVTEISSTVHSQSTTLTCRASGVPDQYTFERWVHTFNGVRVSDPEQLPASPNLTLTGLSYAHSGVYRCGASNGIKNVSYGDGTLLVQSFPILIGDRATSKELKVYGQLMKPTVITFQYYSNADNGSVKVLKSNGSEEIVYDFHQRSVDVKLLVFKSEIMTSGTEVSINITVEDESQFGEYQIIVENNIGSVNISLIIQPLGPPETPTYVRSTVLDHHSVIISWISGFHNGLNQTFIIQISKDNSSWQNTTQDGGMSFQQTHTLRVDKLASSQQYFVRMLAKNGEGASQPTRIFSFETEASPNPTSSSIGLIAGGAAGGSVAALLVIAVIIFIVWRTRDGSPSGNAKDTGTHVVSSTLNLEYDNGDEEVENPAYVSAGPRETNTAIGFSSNEQETSPDGGNIYAKVNKKPEVVYAMPNNKKGKSTEQMDPLTNEHSNKGKKAEKNVKQKPCKADKGGKKQQEKIIKTTPKTGDVYENAPSTMFGIKSNLQPEESVYEVASTTTTATSMKPVGTDGLIYADLDFGPEKKSHTKIIGIEDRCEYTTLDLTKKAQPLADSDDEDKRKQ